MANIFSVGPGIAVPIRDPRAVPMTISAEGWGGFASRQAIVQRVSVSSTGNFQFMHTLRNYIYVYVFGERIGELILSGVAFAGTCSGWGGDGISKVMRYYAQKGIGFTGRPLGVQIGASGFQAFLVGAQFDINNPEAQIGQFQLKFNILPPEG